VGSRNGVVCWYNRNYRTTVRDLDHSLHSVNLPTYRKEGENLETDQHYCRNYFIHCYFYRCRLDNVFGIVFYSNCAVPYYGTWELFLIVFSVSFCLHLIIAMIFRRQKGRSGARNPDDEIIQSFENPIDREGATSTPTAVAAVGDQFNATIGGKDDDKLIS
jgi:hypothetical protein